MIKVKVYAPPWCKMDKLDERSWLELPDKATLSDVFKAIRISKPMAKILRASVNGIVSSPSTVLEDGDVVGFFAMFSGG